MRSFIHSLLEVKRTSEVIDCKTNSFLGHSVWSAYVWQLARLVRYIDNFESERADINVLEWGCGVGFHGEVLRKLGFNVISCDLPDSLSTGQQYITTDSNIIPLEHQFKLPFVDQQFHVVLSFGVLEHVPAETEHLSIKEISRILSDNGIFFITMLPAINSYIHKLAHLRNDFYHDRLYSSAKVAQLLEPHCLNIEKINRAQVLPRSMFGRSLIWEFLDRFLCIPFRMISTNFEIVARKVKL